MKKQNKAYLYAIIAITFWSTVATAFKIALRSVDYLQLLCYSSFVSVIIFFVLILIQGKIKILFQFSLSDILKSALLGFLNPFLYYVILFKAYSLLPAQIAQPLNYTWPIMLVILSIPLLKQKLKLKSFIAIIISFIGVILISSEGNISAYNVSNPLGVGLALGSSIIWALFWIFNVKDKRDDVIKLFLNFFFGFIFILFILLYKSEITIPKFEGIIAVIYVGIFEMGITFVLWLKAMKLTSSNDKISNLVFLSPFISLIFIHFILGEHIFFTTIIGLILIIVGIIIQQKKYVSVHKL
ncbi:MAG: DMT family transporter [Bacteroidales bacterium]|nr:DMT family transporter [Bacteroidales bacterium]